MSLHDTLNDSYSSDVSALARGRVLFLGAGAAMRCGVGQFTGHLFERTRRAIAHPVRQLVLTRDEGTLGDIRRAIGNSDTVVCNYPIVAWKRVILRPLLALVLARLLGRRVVLVLHEWSGLHWMRRLTYLPALVLANSIVLFSPLVRRQLERDVLVGWTARRGALAPLPPNVEAPSGFADSALRRRLAAARRDGRLVIGHFGSIYPGKQPVALLEIGARLRAQGHRPLLAYVGSFIRGTDTIEDDFNARAAELGVVDDVVVSGFVASDRELFGILSEVDVFCYRLDEGLSARRASILAAVQSGRPVVVTAPEEADEFAHHPTFARLIAEGAISLVGREQGDEAYAQAILAAAKRETRPPTFDFNASWRDAVNAISRLY